MKCNRCQHEIARKEDLMVLYPRYSDGRKWAYILCSACIPDFAAFMHADARGNPAPSTEEEAPPQAE